MRFLANIAVLVLVLLFASPAHAQRFYQTSPPACQPGMACYRPAPAQVQAQAYAQAYAQAQPATQPQYQASADPYGFTAWLNATRAAYRLPAVAYDSSLSGWAAANNAQQHVRGMGHHIMGPAKRQNAAMGQYAQIGSMWLNSPGHRAALLDPNIRRIGLAGSGLYWTFNAN